MTESNIPMFISDNEVSELTDYPHLIETMANCMAEYSRKLKHDDIDAVVQPVRQILTLQDRGFMAVMSAYMPRTGGLATKLVTVLPDQTPSHKGVIILFDAEKGDVKALVDAEKLTSYRTAAVSAAASRRLAPRNASTLAILGTGVQAVTHIHAHLLEPTLAATLRHVNVYGRNFEKAQSLVENLSNDFPEIEFVAFKTVAEAVREADIICTVTFSSDPILWGEWMLKTNCHINAVGACRPHWRELDQSVTDRTSSGVFVDSHEGALTESGDILLNGPARIAAELGEIILHEDSNVDYRNEFTVFKSLGMAVQDVTAALYIFNKKMAQS